MLRFTGIAAMLVGIASARKCQELVVPVSLTSQNAVFNLEPRTTGIEVTDFYLNLAQQPGSYVSEITERVRSPLPPSSSFMLPLSSVTTVPLANTAYR